MKRFIYGGKPKKLTKVLADVCPLISYNQVRRLLENKDIKVNGTRVNADVIVEDGAEVVVYVKDTALKTVYEDDNLTVVYKPKGLASEGEVSAESVMHAVNADLILCHRLDTNTDGLLMFAKSERIADEMTTGFSGHAVEKHYLARVYGTLQKDAVLHGWLSKDADAGIVKVFDERVKGASEITTSYKVLGVDGNSTLLDVTIYGGKTHQIRAHLAHVGHFVLGDGKYGRDEINRKYGYKKQQLTATALTFNFPKESPLNYLNSTKIEL